MRTPIVEKVLVERLKAGDEAAVADLAAAYGTKIYQLAFRHLRNREDAEEVMQDVLYKVYRKIDAFRGESALSSWIYRITFNAAMSRLRNGRFSRPNEVPEQTALVSDGEGAEGSRQRKDVADWSALADEEVMRSQMRRRLWEAIVRLPAIYRAPVLLRDIQGLSTEEASAILKVKDQTLKSRLHRGRLILRNQLADFAGGLSLHHPLSAAS
ncbi:MAG TPA: sigma-70 family RNA polymerase sigma factor [Vicinamibacterales bacterium]|nr:sigma-70 family RNA polymerase sigma factor [Vicinamibacterales bacterium]